MKTIRRWSQWLWLLLTNGYLGFPFSDPIYQGPLKVICAPGLNCYSCPAATSYCLLGSLQQLLAGIRLSLQSGSYFLGFYVLASMGILGTALGRFICGWACPFGLFQELLFKIPSPKYRIPPVLRWGKYLFLTFFVLLLPLLVVDEFGLGQPWFCKYLCPTGTLEAGLPLLVLLPELRTTLGWLFYSKLTLAFCYLGWSVLASRPFCRTSCPLGAFYGLFNRFSLVQLKLDPKKCTQCGACHAVCPVEIRFNETPNSPECINCLKCMHEACSFNAISVDLAGCRLHPGSKKQLNHHGISS
ncbi:4Fe-4S binding protein [Desulfogranum mediterraneum]|uniref:4Fe-4S binding protein n=1 Tax=Desulfogranum mediterraneum TaxID=160661 RepID=UPI00041EBD51|nr:4Fe-4S binding protein [Desulfogranum mediterraneum]